MGRGVVAPRLGILFGERRGRNLFKYRLASPKAGAEAKKVVAAKCVTGVCL